MIIDYVLYSNFVPFIGDFWVQRLGVLREQPRHLFFGPQIVADIEHAIMRIIEHAG